MKPVQLPVVDYADRMAAGLVAWPTQGHAAHVLVISFYGYPGDLTRASDAYESSMMEAVAVYGGLLLVLGDFNCVQQAGNGRNRLHLLDVRSRSLG